MSCSQSDLTQRASATTRATHRATSIAWWADARFSLVWYSVKLYHGLHKNGVTTRGYMGVIYARLLPVTHVRSTRRPRNMGTLMFGKDETIECIQHIEQKGPKDESLCLAYKTTKTFVGGGVWLKDDGYVI